MLQQLSMMMEYSLVKKKRERIRNPVRVKQLFAVILKSNPAIRCRVLRENVCA